MPEPIQAGLWGALAGSALVLGAVVALTARVPRRMAALIMGFGAGALVSALTLDLAEEAFRVGGTLVGAGSVNPASLAAVLISNLPEGLAGSRDLAEDGHSRRWILGLWIGVAAASGVAAAIGNAVASGMTAIVFAAAQSFAAGAILTMPADTMFPEAFRAGGDRVGLATALGFAAAFLLSKA